MAPQESTAPASTQARAVPGTGSSCEPDEARGSQRREAYSLDVERRGRPSNEVWRRKLTQYPLPRDPGDGCGAADPPVAAVGDRLGVPGGYEHVTGSAIRQWVQDILRHGMPRDVTAAARGLEGRCPSSQPLSECLLPGIRVAV